MKGWSRFHWVRNRAIIGNVSLKITFPQYSHFQASSTLIHLRPFDTYTSKTPFRIDTLMSTPYMLYDA